MTATRPSILGARHDASSTRLRRRSPGHPVGNGGRGTLRAGAGACRFTIFALCRHFDPKRDLSRARRTALVSKGSPVRVRQRALAKPLETVVFLCSGVLMRRWQGLEGPYMGRIRSK